MSSNARKSSIYKNKIISLLLKNKDFIKLLNPHKAEHPSISTLDVLLGGEWIINGKEYSEQGHIFDFEFVSDVTKDKKTFCFVETDMSGVTSGVFSNFNLYIFVFASRDLIKLTDNTQPTVREVKDMGYFAGNRGNRVDILCDIVDSIMNGNNKMVSIGDVTPDYRDYMTIYTPNPTYYGKCLKYNVRNYNETGDCYED